MPVSVSDVATFDKEIQSKDPSVFLFGMGTSEPYKRALDLISSYNAVKVYEVNLELKGAADITTKVGVSKMPTVLVYKEGKKIDEAVRPTPSAIRGLIQKL